MIIQQGDLYWIQAESAIPHPYVVIQVSADQEVIRLCGLTSNLQRVSWPGNVLIPAGEGNLSKPSVVEVGKTITLAPNALGSYIGHLSDQRLTQILAGIQLLHNSFFPRDDQA